MANKATFILVAAFIALTYGAPQSNQVNPEHNEAAPCRDYYKQCEKHAALPKAERERNCIRYAKRYCPKTCGVCNGPATPAPKTTTTTKKPMTTTTKKPKPDCPPDRFWCKRSTTVCSTKWRNLCPNKCSLNDCGKPTVTTKKPATTQRPTRPTTKPKPDTTMKTTTRYTPRPTTKSKTTTSKPITVQPPSGGCADKKPFCFMKHYSKSQLCAKNSQDCIATCGLCQRNGTNKCAALSDRAPNCSSRNCRASDKIERHRAHMKCARTCCDRGELM